MKNKENKELEGKSQIKGGLILTAFFLLMFLSGCTGNIHEELENECIRLGYENLTDYNIETRRDWVTVAQIECDNKVLWNECYNREVYEWDKWNNHKVIDHIWECND